MKRSYRSALLVLVLALGTLALARYARPTFHMGVLQHESLESVIPSDFGEWQLQPDSGVLIVDPQTEEFLGQLYTDIVRRTYVNKQGYRVMLSVAYGNEQSKALQIHRPEVCYASQGFLVSDLNKVSVVTGIGSIPAMTLIASRPQRYEPVTYWIRMGSKIVRGNVELGLARIEYGLRRQIPDGLLFRVSSIDTNQQQAFLQQRAFINELLTAMPKEERSVLTGETSL